MRSAEASDAAIDGVPVVTEAFPRTVRLVATARLRAPMLAPLVDGEEELKVLAEIEGATSARLIAEDRGISGLAANELVHDVPHASFINASFAYARPQQPNRFNGASRGASNGPCQGASVRSAQRRRAERARGLAAVSASPGPTPLRIG